MQAATVAASSQMRICFAAGEVQADTWRHFESNLAPGGRIMANLGCFARAEAALRAMAEVFGPGVS